MTRWGRQPRCAQKITRLYNFKKFNYERECLFWSEFCWVLLWSNISALVCICLLESLLTPHNLTLNMNIQWKTKPFLDGLTLDTVVALYLDVQLILLRFCHRSDGRHGFEKNISSSTVSYTALPMKTDLHFQQTLSKLHNFQQTSIQLFFVFMKTLRNCVALT